MTPKKSLKNVKPAGMNIKMSEFSLDDNSLEAMRFRLESLQEQLGAILLKGERLMADLSGKVPHPADVPKAFPFTEASALNSTFSKELNVVLPCAKLVIDRNSPNFPSFPARRVALWTPQHDALKKRTVVKDISHQSPEFPFDVEVSIFNHEGTRHIGFIGYGYVEQEPHIEEIDRALDQARSLATTIFELIPVSETNV